MQYIILMEIHKEFKKCGILKWIMLSCHTNTITIILLKSCAEVVLVHITNIIHLSLKSGILPDAPKLSHIKIH